MKLFKKLFVFLTVLVLMLTVTACTIDESELNNLLNGLLTSNNSANVTTSNTLPVRPSTSTSSNYGVDSSSEPYYPINPTESTNSSIYLVPPSPPVEISPEYSASKNSAVVNSSQTNSNSSYKTNALYSFENLASYGFDYYFWESTTIEPFIVSPNVKIKTSAGKTAKDGSAKGYMFTCGLHLGKDGSFNSKSLQFSTNGYQQIEIYATRASSLVTSCDLFVIDSQGYVVDSITVTVDLFSNVLTIPSAGTYALVATIESSINVWGVSFIENA